MLVAGQGCWQVERLGREARDVFSFAIGGVGSRDNEVLRSRMNERQHVERWRKGEP